MPNAEQLTKQMNFQLGCNQEARVKGGVVVVDIFRGSTVRHNRHKVAELKFLTSGVEIALQNDTFVDLVNDAERKLNIPLYTLRDSVDPVRIA